MKNLIIAILFLLPITLSAQLLRSYGVVEIGSTFPTSTVTGAKFAYRTVDSSYYRWVSGNTWVKILKSSIDPDTLYLKQLSGTTAIVDGDTINISTYLLHSDTASMLDPYIKLAGYGLSKLVGHTLQVDTSVISTKTYTNRFLLKSDTLNMLSKYIERGDTASMLLRYPSTTGFGFVDGGKTWSADSTKLATRYHVGANFFPLQGGTLTGTGGAGFIGFPSQVSAPGTPASGLNVYAQGSSFNWKGTDGYERQFASTLTGGRTYTLPNASGTFTLGTGTATRVPIWTSANILGDSPILYNSTTKRTTWDSPSVIELPMGTDAQRPSPATTSDFWYGQTGLEVYNGTRWAKIWESTANTFTQNRIPYTDVNGQATTNSAFNFNGTQLLLTPSTAVGKKLFINSTATPIATGIDIDLGGKYSGTATSVPKLAIYNDGTYQFGFGMWNNGLSYIVDHNTLGHYFYAGVDSTLKLSITKTVVNLPQFTTFGSTGVSGNLVSIGANSVSTNSRLYIQSPDQGVASGIAIKSTNTSFLGYASVYLESANGEASQFFSTNSTYTPYRTIAASTFGHYSTAANGMAIQLDGASAVLKVGLGANEITRTTTTGFGILNTSPQRPLHVTGAARITGSAGTPTGILGRDGNGDISNLTLGTNLSITGGTLNAATGTDTHFANTNLTATGNRTHDWANYNFTWTNMKKFMWGADSLFKITKEFSGLTTSVLRNPSGQTLFDLQGDDDFASSSAEIRLTDTETGNIVFIAHDDRGFGTDGFRIEHYNGSNYHNILFVDKTSRLFHVNQNENSSGTMFEGDAAISDGLFKNIYRNGVVTSASDSITALHFFRAENNHSKNKDVFGVYTGSATADTMYFRLDKVGRLFQYKPSFLFNTVSFSDYGVGNKEASDLSKTQSNYIAGFATDGTVLDLERRRDTTVYVVDTDLDWSAAITTAQISRRYNRVIFLMTTTAAAGSNSDLTLHTPDVNLMQVEYLIRSTDETGGFTNTIQFGSNNAVASDNALAGSYTPSPGQGVGIRAGLRSGIYKYFYY